MWVLTNGKRNRKYQERLPVNIVPVFSPVEELLGNPSNNGPVCNGQYDDITPGLSKPKSHCSAGTTATGSKTLMACVFDQVQCQEEEWITQAIICSRLSNDDLLKTGRDILIGELALHDAVRQDRVCGRNT